MPRDWNEYYRAAGGLDLTPAPLLVEAADQLPPGQALDLACGPGRNALHLARLGWEVTAVDSSPVAIGLLKQRADGLAIHAHIADLEKPEFTIVPSAYDLVCDFLYLRRDLFPSIRAGVRPGGLFIGAIHLIEPGHGQEFSLRPGELRAEFDGWKILYYSEGAERGHTHRSAHILARRA